MCRKKLTEVEGCEVAQKLSNNAFLQRLQLEGNQLGAETLFQIAKLLGSNESIRLIDLEGNKLTKGLDDKPDYKGTFILMQVYS